MSKDLAFAVFACFCILAFVFGLAEIAARMSRRLRAKNAARALREQETPQPMTVEHEGRKIVIAPPEVAEMGLARVEGPAADGAPATEPGTPAPSSKSDAPGPEVPQELVIARPAQQTYEDQRFAWGETRSAADDLRPFSDIVLEPWNGRELGDWRLVQPADLWSTVVFQRQPAAVPANSKMRAFQAPYGQDASGQGFAGTLTFAHTNLPRGFDGCRLPVNMTYVALWLGFRVFWSDAFGQPADDLPPVPDSVWRKLVWRFRHGGEALPWSMGLCLEDARAPVDGGGPWARFIGLPLIMRPSIAVDHEIVVTDHAAVPEQARGLGVRMILKGYMLGAPA